MGTALYECFAVHEQPPGGPRTVSLRRADGSKGWLGLTGTAPELDDFEEGKLYEVTVPREVPRSAG